MTDDQAEEMLALLRAIAKKIGAHVPRPRSDAPPEDASRSVSVVRPGRGARFVPQQGHPHEGRFDDSGYPTSTVRSKADFWKRRD